ncbi:50S ribosomal protein L29, partial [Arcobacteraceae bacterium]|nr:50S ribosomal protein L29 [Arcobacteraceae bacterium]
MNYSDINAKTLEELTVLLKEKKVQLFELRLKLK